MREIKFRYYDEETKTMSEPFEVGSAMSMELKPEMQYIGLKDKKGKDICECDKVTDGRKEGVVQYNTDRAMFEVFWGYGNIVGFDKFWAENNLEVIGNTKEKKT